MSETIRQFRYPVFISLMAYTLCMIICLILMARAAPQILHKPAKGFVPDSMTAIKVAEAILTPIYGKKVIEGEKPFHAKLKNGIWTVEGTLPIGFDGGVAEIDISKEDARILRVTHGK